MKETAKSYDRFFCMYALLLVMVLSKCKQSQSLAYPVPRGKLQMAAQDLSSFYIFGSRRRRMRNKVQQISNSFSTFSPPLLFEDDTFSSITTSINYIRQEVSGDTLSKKIRPVGRKSRNISIFSRLKGVEDENLNSILMSDIGFYDGAVNESILSFLPGKGSNLPPQTTNVLSRLTSMYLDAVTSQKQSSDIFQEIMDAVDEEHRSISIAFKLNGEEYFDETACKLLAFVVLHKVPFEIISHLLQKSGEEEPDSLLSHTQTQEILSLISSYNSLEFSTRKLPIRLRSKHTPKFISLQRENSIDSIKAASTVIAPQKRPTTEDLLDSITQLSSTVPQSSLFKSFALRKRFEDLQFFPMKKKKWMKEWTQIMRTQTLKLKSAGRAGLISYGLLNAIWYSLATVLSWKRVTVSPYTGGLETLFQISLWKFSRVLTFVYVGSQITKLPRLILAAIMAPFGGRILQFLEQNLNVGSNTAFWIAAGLMIGSCLSVWVGIIFFDAFLSSGGSFFM